MERLIGFASNKYSQFGEDGIIEKIFQIIPQENQKKRVCVEFGAWDGFHLSNTANLWTNGWNGILIEADKMKYIDLIKNVKQYNCVCINDYVSFPASNTLEKILDNNRITDEIDFLSIDIDGDDYYVLESLDKLKPKVICCEYNPTMPFHMSLIGKRGSYIGCSALALVDLAETKGYGLVAITNTNCFFVRKDYLHNFNMYETSLSQLQIDFLSQQVYLITTYDGDYVFSKKLPFGLNNAYKGILLGDNVYKYNLFTIHGIYKRFFSKWLRKHPTLKNILKSLYKLLRSVVKKGVYK